MHTCGVHLCPAHEKSPHLHVLTTKLVLVALAALHKVEHLPATFDGVADAVGSEDDARAELGEHLPIEPRVIDQHTVIVDEIEVRRRLPVQAVRCSGGTPCSGDP